MSKNNFVSHFLPFFYKMAAGDHFGCPKITFGRISGHFRSILNFYFCDIFTKWQPGAHFGCPNFKMFGGHFGCLKITLDRISGHFRLIGHFGCSKFTFDGISGHFRSIKNRPLGPIHTKDARFFCCGNSAADISRVHTRKHKSHLNTC